MPNPAPPESLAADATQPAQAIGLALIKARHDLNNLFHVSRSWARMLKDPRTSLDQSQEGIAAVLDAAAQVSELIDGILALNGRATEALAPCNLTEELALLARGLRYLLPAPERLRVELDSRTHALCNVADVRRALLGAVLGFAGELGDDELSLRLSDSPDGISVELELRRVARKPTGAPAAPRLQLSFPAAARGPTPSRTASPASAAVHSSNSSPVTAEKPGVTRVLLVDDHREVRRLATTMLERAGYQVLTASDAQEALVTSDSYDGPIHLLWCDAQMPGLPPLQLINQLCAARPDLRVLVCSGGNPPGKLAKFPRLQKPFSYQQLIATVRACLG